MSELSMVLLRSVAMTMGVTARASAASSPAVVPNERAVSLEGPGERDADPAREMVVTRARLA